MDGVAYSYTDRGTLHQRVDGTLMETFSYDALGNLTRVERNGGSDIDYVIDAKGRRVGKRIDGSLRKQYVWGGALRIVAELNSDGVVAKRFIYGHGLTTPDLIVRRDPNSPDRLYRVISDHLGSPVYVVNIADPADVWLDASYDEWGNVIDFKLDGVEQSDTSDWPIPQGFAGGLYDAEVNRPEFPGATQFSP
jgi:YD repeat-containing protein